MCADDSVRMHPQVPAMATLGLNPVVIPAAVPGISSSSLGVPDLATAAAAQAHIVASQGRGGAAVRLQGCLSPVGLDSM